MAPVWWVMLLVAGPADPVAGNGAGVNPVSRVRSPFLDLEYEVEDSALPLTAVRLWYTLDGGANWTHYGEDEDRHPPFPFEAPREGEFGFYLVMENGGGASGPPPGAGTAPQLTAFVDFSPPVVQVYTPIQATSLGQRVLQLRWTALDANFPSRPIELAYQYPVGGEWQLVSADPVANTGRYDWRVPGEVTGMVALRVAARDRGGFRTESEVVTAEVAPEATAAAPPPSAHAAVPASELPVLRVPVKSAVGEATDASRAQAVRLYAEALGHRDRGEYRQAVARLRDVVRLDPEGVEAMQEMGSLLYMSGDYERSLEAYRLVLARQPMNRTALLGAARVHRQRQEYESAAEMLRSWLRFNPNDGEAWMALGDLGVYQGDEILARECYLRAMQAKSGGAGVAADARQRLSLMTEAKRTGGGNGDGPRR